MIINKEQKELLHFFNNVMIKLNIHGWKLILNEDKSEGYCWINKKNIDIGLNYENPKELLIHEIAHINICRFCNNKHTFDFWKTFLDYMRRFIPKEKISKNASNHMKFAGNGYYRKCYDDEKRI